MWKIWWVWYRDISESLKSLSIQPMILTSGLYRCLADTMMYRGNILEIMDGEPLVKRRLLIWQTKPDNRVMQMLFASVYADAVNDNTQSTISSMIKAFLNIGPLLLMIKILLMLWSIIFIYYLTIYNIIFYLTLLPIMWLHKVKYFQISNFWKHFLFIWFTL